MINKERIVKEFIELVQIDSLSLQEREMADALTKKLKELGLEVYEDDAGIKLGGNAGNLITILKGNTDKEPILLMAHMDTVTPGIGKNPVIKDGVIKSDGTTILGGDDLAGVVSILETLRTVIENNIPHGDIQVAFTIGEEAGLLGSKNLDYSKIHAKYGFVLDASGDIGTVAVKAPSQNKIDIVLTGKAAHAGICPEKGISAIQIAARAMSEMRLGRIDHETTANVGIIHGGKATNIICDKVELNAEARSLDENKLRIQTEHMKECFETAAEALGGKAEVNIEISYPSYTINPEAGIISVLDKAAEQAGVELKLEATGGGSDTNIINGKGIEAVDISIGMDKVHSVEEQIRVEDLEKASEFLLAIVANIPVR